MKITRGSLTPDKARGGYELVYRIDGRRTRERGPTRDACEDKRRARIAALVAAGASGPAEGDDVTLGQLIAEYALIAGPGLAATTLTSRRRAVDRLIEVVGPDRTARSIRARDVNRLTSSLVADGLRRSSVNAARRNLSAVFRFAVANGYADANPVTGTKVAGGAASKPRRSLSLDDARLLGKTIAAEGGDQAVGFALMVWAGLRLGEVAGLEWSAVDLAAGTIHVRAQATPGGRITALKTSSSRRVVGIAAPLAAMLADHRANRPGARFVCSPDDRPVPHSTLQQGLIRACRRAGVPARSPHALRHTAGSLLYSACNDLTEVAAFLGHSDLTLVQTTYVHRTDEAVPGASITRLGW